MPDRDMRTFQDLIWYQYAKIIARRALGPEANGNNGNQFREDEIIILEQLRDGKMVKNIFPKIGGRLRLAHEANEQLSITTEIIKYDKNLAVIRAITTTVKGDPPGLDRDCG